MSGLRGELAACVLALLVIAGCLAYAYHLGRAAADLSWQAKWDKQTTVQATARADADREARAEEQRRQTALNGVGENARNQSAALAADAAGNDAAGQRLHTAANKLAAGASCAPSDPGIARRGQAATRAAMVLSELLTRADQRAGELATAYDRARIAGLACEKAYDALARRVKPSSQ